MPTKEFHFCWEWDLKSSPQAMWPFVSDTNRFNANAGIPSVKRVEAPGAREGTQRLKMKVAGMTMEWDEAPFEWAAPNKFGVSRKYHSGPIAEIRVKAELTPRSGGGSHLKYEIWMVPRNLLGRLFIPFQMKWKSAPTFDALFRQYDALAQMERPKALPAASVTFAPGGRERLASIRKALTDGGAETVLVNRLLELVETADDLTLMRLRPYGLADSWGVSRRKVLELCLLATRAGLFDFRWDMLCPLCRGSKGPTASLSGIQAQVHCDSCNIDFAVNFDRSVELTFRPNPAIRPIDIAEFCVGGPMVTPHIVLQQKLAPGEKRTMLMPLEPGRYRIRTRALTGGQFVQVTDDGPGEAKFAPTREGWPEAEEIIGTKPALVLENRTDAEQIFVLERMAWTDLAVTAAEVTALQVFRDLFAKEALRPGEQISVGGMTVLFTDLRDSTRLYREIGDARAFGLVMSHFDVLKKSIADHDGALVKTIGDAVLAVFRRPASAVAALLDAEQQIGKVSVSGNRLLLKAGIHTGPCIAVTLNDRLDYFGSTVNVAARLVGLSTGGDLVISEAVRQDPEVRRLLAEKNYPMEDIKALLKGFDTMKFDLVRIIPPWAAAGKTQTEPKTQRF